MMQQVQNLNVLNGRLHEINDGLNVLLQKHDLEVSIRAAECRRRHLKLSRQCLGLAAKTQCLRNRGYAMDGAEEELRKKLLGLEKQVFDPALDGRGEEIWARMVSVRERGRQLQREYERAGRGLGGDNERKGGTVIDEEILKRAMKVREFPYAISGTNRELTWPTTDLGRLSFPIVTSSEGVGGYQSRLGGVHKRAASSIDEWEVLALC